MDIPTANTEPVDQLVVRCTVCGKDKKYKSLRHKLKGQDKPCRSCANSIARGGTGKFYDTEGKKQCGFCKKYLEASNYYTTKTGTTTYCKICSNRMSGTYIKGTHRYEKYGITEQVYRTLIETQKNCCAICENTFNSATDIRIDHDHTTKHVRGLLCHSCNVALGHFKDNITILQTAIKYITKWS